MKKYELLQDDFIELFSGVKLYRIKAVATFGNVESGEIGGYIEKEGSLSQSGDAWVYGNARVYGDARVSGDAQVSGNARVCGDAWVSGNARVYGDAWVYGDAQVSGNARVCGDAQVSGDARVEHESNYVLIHPIGSENGTFTAYKTKTGISCNRGCFYGTLDEFAERVKQTHGDNQYAQEYQVVIELVRKRLGEAKFEGSEQE